MVIPFSLTPSWVGAWLRRTDIPEVCGKSLARCDISTGRLTIPVVGGASVLKRRGADPILSEHGKWRREHLGAWNAAYGRTPYYIHLMPQIEEVYAASESLTLSQFNARLLDIVTSWIEPGILCTENPALESIRNEIKVKIEPSLSIFDAIFRLGKETAFGL